MLICALAAVASGSQDPCLNLSQPVRTNDQLQFTLTGESGITYVIESSGNLRDWTPVATNTDPGFSRTISVPTPYGSNFYRAARSGVPVFAAGLASLQSITLNGITITIDGYDSADSVNFPDGVYNSSNAFPAGTVACRTGYASLENAKVHGQILLGPGATFGLGAGGLIGDMNWSGGVEPPFTDWVVTNFLFCLPDVALSYTNCSPPPPPMSGTNAYVLVGGDFCVPGDFRVSQNLLVVGPARLYVAGNFSAAAITIQPGASLGLFVGQASGAPVSATVGNVSNAGSALAFNVFGLPTLTSLTLGGTNNTFVGAFYVPDAPVTVNGGGNVSVEIQGALAAQSINFNGHVNLHFDVNLKRRGPQR